MRRLSTKADREAVREAAFKHLIEQGFAREDYKGLVIFSRDRQDEGRFDLKIYKGTASSPYHNYYYRQVERRNEAIVKEKGYFDRNEAYKAEQKAKGGYHSTAAMAAAAIKAELQAKYPGIKFSVKSDTYSMGSSVRASWVDGPSYDEVDSLISKYQYGHFDGMQDLYEISNSRDDIPQAKHVFAERSMSEETRAILEPQAAEIWADRDYRNRDILYIIFRKTSLPAGAKVTGLVRTDVDCGLAEDFYRIAFEAPEQAPVKPEAPDYEKVEVPAGEIQIVDYSERSFAVIGETKPIKDQLYDMGGKFNKNLSCGPGWIFSKRRLEAVQNALNQLANV